MPTPTLDDLRRYAVARTLCDADHAGARDRAARLRAGRPDPRAGARAGPDAAPPRRRLPRRRPRAPLRAPRRRGGLLRQLRLHAARPHCALMHPRRQRAPWDAATRRRAPQRCSRSCASAARRTRARSTRTSRTAASRTTGAARRTRPPTCSTACTTAGCCAWSRRDGGIRVYAPRVHAPQARQPAARRARIDALVDVIVRKYAPLPALRLSTADRRLRYAVPQHRERARRSARRARRRASRMHASTAATGTGRPTRIRARAAPRSATTRCGCSRRSIRSSGTAAASSCSGAGPTASRPTRRRRSASSATTRCRCCGATTSIGWANLAVEGGRLRPVFGYVDRKPASDPLFKRALEAELDAMRRFLAL